MPLLMTITERKKIKFPESEDACSNNYIDLQELKKFNFDPLKRNLEILS